MTTPSVAATSVSFGSTVERSAASVLERPDRLGLIRPTENRYEFRGSLGRGGLGEVFRVFDRSIRRDVALKILRPDRAGPSMIARFVEEGQIGGQLEHPNIAPVHEIGVTLDGQVYFTMKLVEGRSLRERIHEAQGGLRAGLGEDRFPLVRRIDVFKKICDAVGFAHDRGVIHRDLKPSNVMLGTHGEVLVMDWGLARILGEVETHGDDVVRSDRHEEGIDPTRPGTTAGTPGYMSPEQILGNIQAQGARSDVYALGTILYELLTFTRPFEGDDPQSTLLSALKDPLEPAAARARRLFGPGRGAPVVPRELEAIAGRALARDPGQRYDGVPALLADVEAWQADRPVTALPDSLPVRVVKWTRRHPTRALALALGGVFAAALAVVVAVSQSRAAASARDQARLERRWFEAELARRETARDLERTSNDLIMQVATKGSVERSAFGYEREAPVRDFEREWREALAQGRTSQEFLAGVDDATRLEWSGALESSLAGREGDEWRLEDFYLALVRFREDPDASIEDYRRAVRESPAMWEAWTELALALLERGRADEETATALENALARGPDAAIRSRLEEALGRTAPR